MLGKLLAMKGQRRRRLIVLAVLFGFPMIVFLRMFSSVHHHYPNAVKKSPGAGVKTFAHGHQVPGNSQKAGHPQLKSGGSQTAAVHQIPPLPGKRGVFHGRVVKTPEDVTDRNRTYPGTVCFNVTLDRLVFPFCAGQQKSPNASYWEEPDVVKTLQMLRGKFPRARLLDIANDPGTYTLPAAKLTKVISVRQLPNAMAQMAQAVRLGGVQSNVTMVLNAVSNRRRTFQLTQTRVGNTTRTVMSSALSASCQQWLTDATVKRACRNRLVHALILDDLMPLMPANRSHPVIIHSSMQGREVDMFTDATATNFFRYVDVRLVLVRWQGVATQSASKVAELLHFFDRRHFAPATTALQPLPTGKDYLKWPRNVVFKK